MFSANKSNGYSYQFRNSVSLIFNRERDSDIISLAAIISVKHYGKQFNEHK